ncbi:intracellular hyaluronan-binding protein 4-like [Salarias fasciatus]|uniref:intracellular hyaluronan-binding protein 4-like n=1 Tax=Salarias fasciatus TaxID=181472 RepID=UPI001177020D|nr:intracellular hyaluronan-binding protein 4-like [Salarias fasciatus]
MLPDAYGCVVANRFGDLLDDDADPFDLITQVEAEKEKQRKKKKEEEEKKKKTKQKRPGQRESQKDRRLPRGSDAGQDPVPVLKPGQAYPAAGSQSGQGKEQGQRGMKRAAAGQRRAKQEEHPLEPSTDKPSYNPDSYVEGRGGSRGRRGARSGGYSRNSDGFNQRGRREFDRHNGTGISPEEKRGGRGPWNWGAAEDDAGELMEVTPDESPKNDEPQTPTEGNPNGNAEEENGEIMVHVAMEMSLDEWKAMQEMKRPKSEFNIRKAEDKIPSKAKVIHQSKNLEILKTPMEDGEDEGNYLRKSVNDITSLLDINFGSLGRPSRGGRGRGGRGGQSVRWEGPKLAPEKDELAPNPDDPEDFPALSAGK